MVSLGTLCTDKDLRPVDSDISPSAHLESQVSLPWVYEVLPLS